MNGLTGASLKTANERADELNAKLAKLDHGALSFSRQSRLERFADNDVAVAIAGLAVSVVLAAIALGRR